MATSRMCIFPSLLNSSTFKTSDTKFLWHHWIYCMPQCYMCRECPFTHRWPTVEKRRCR